MSFFKTNKNQLELPLREFEISEKILKEKRWNQAKHIINKSWGNEVYKEREPSKPHRTKDGEIIGFSIPIRNEIKEEFKLYKKYKKNEKAHRRFKDIVISADIISTKSLYDLKILLTKSYNKSKKKNKGVFVYKIDDEIKWNNFLYEAIKIFHDYPMSVYE